MFIIYIFYEYKVIIKENYNTEKQLRILCLGDSLTAGTTSNNYFGIGYSASLKENLDKRFPQKLIEVEHYGFPGWTAQELLDNANKERGLASILQTSSDNGIPFTHLLLMCGTNDLGHGRTPEEISVSISSLYDVALNVTPNINIISLGIPDNRVNHMNGVYRKRREEANNQIELAAKTKDVIFYSTETIFPYIEANELWDKDGLHFSEKGYKVFGDRLAKLLHRK